MLLEIGCGNGVAAALIAEKLVTGSLTALDASTSQTRLAEARNSAHIAAGQVSIQTAALDNAQLDAATFNKIFAINVNVFWQKPETELARIRKLLAHNGRLYLFYQPPDASKNSTIAEKTMQNLETHGFRVTDTIFKDIAPIAGVCICAQAS